MKKTLFIGAILALCLTGTIAADTTSFKIQDFIPQRFKDFQWKLDGNASMGGSYTHSQATDDPSYLYDNNYDNTNNRFSGAVYGSTDFNYRYRSVPYYLSLSGYLSLSYKRSEQNYESDAWSTNDDDYGTYSKEELSADMVQAKQELSIDAGKYFYRDIFIAGVASAGLSYFNNEDDLLRTTSYDHLIDSIYYHGHTRLDGGASDDSRYNSVSLEIGPGLGRVYEGWYASTAMYIIEELRSNQLLLREPTKDEMMTLCDLVYQNRLKHAIDARLRRIEIFDEIFGYLEKTGLMSYAGHYSYLLIQDVWDYFPRKSRSFGAVARVSIGGRYAFSSRHLTAAYENTVSEEARQLVDSEDSYSLLYSTYYKTNEDRYLYSKTNARDIYLAASFTYAIPLSRRWQLDAAAAAKYYLDSYSNQYDYNSYVREDSADQTTTESSHDINVSYEDNFRISISATGTYIMNSRTQLILSGYFEHSGYDRCEECYGDGCYSYYTYPRLSHRRLGSGGLLARLEYRLAVPTTLTAQVSQRWGDTENDFVADADKYYTRSYSLSVAISHYIY